MYEAWSEEWVVYVMKRIEYGIWGMEHGVCSTQYGLLNKRYDIWSIYYVVGIWDRVYDVKSSEYRLCIVCNHYIKY